MRTPNKGRIYDSFQQHPCHSPQPPNSSLGAGFSWKRAFIHPLQYFKNHPFAEALVSEDFRVQDRVGLSLTTEIPCSQQTSLDVNRPTYSTSVLFCMYICVCVYMYVHLCICTYVCMYVHVYVRICMCVYIYIYVKCSFACCLSNPRYPASILRLMCRTLFSGRGLSRAGRLSWGLGGGYRGVFGRLHGVLWALRLGGVGTQDKAHGLKTVKRFDIIDTGPSTQHDVGTS